MEIFDLGLAFVWEYDDGFIGMLEQVLQKAGLSTYIIGYHNLEETAELLARKKIGFNFYFDRAWDVEESFEELGKSIQRRKTVIINPYKKVLHAIDKASMHLEFLTAGVDVPYSIIIPPRREVEHIKLSVEDLAILGRPFIIKPCNTTGGGIGVVTGAETLAEVLHERLSNMGDKYILQEKVIPAIYDGRRAWFRSFWAFGKTIPVWWDDQTHLYNLLTMDEISRFGLKKLFNITRTIAGVTGLDFFSTEIVVTENRKFIAIDYVNDMCDMRLKSKHFDGVPDEVVKQILINLSKMIIKIKKNMY
jgi:hypothetical protein